MTDIPYSFDAAKLQSSADAFHFLRAFVPYFYLEFEANHASLPVLTSLTDVTGWCAGDAHPENFGALLQENGKSLFGVNDMDDAGPCPVILDLARLMVSSRLYNDSIDLSDMIKAYRHGLENKSEDMPVEISQMLKDSEKKGEDPKKSKVDHKSLVRDSKANEVTSKIASEISTAISGRLPRQSTILDMMETSKVGGGSGGLRRYEVLIEAKQGLVHLELKQEVTPAIYPVATSAIPETAARIRKTLATEQGPDVSAYYSTVMINGLSMLLRPRFSGNIGVSLKDNDTKPNVAIIDYEAFTLGQLHSRSIKDPSALSDRLKNIDESILEGEIDQFDQQFEQKFASLKPQTLSATQLHRPAQRKF